MDREKPNAGRGHPPEAQDRTASDCIPVDVRREIITRLRAAEAEHQVTILLAVESGSRAWGFASPDSDYDVRFIYAHARDWYVAVDLEEKRDVIEYDITDDIDLNGWDVRKALRLFVRSNPAVVEWIQSPIIYAAYGPFPDQARKHLPAIYSVARGIHHYRSMAKTNYRGYLRADRVPLKKYFYVLRPLLATRWLEKYGSAPPIEFHRLLAMAAGDTEFLEAAERLLIQKRASVEMSLAPPIPALNRFIEAELDRLEGILIPDGHPASAVTLANSIFHEALGSAGR